MKTNFTIGAFGIIFNKQNEVLLCHRRDYDLWNLPGGGLNSGESPWDGAKREVKEETGLDVEIIKLSGIYSKPNNDAVFSFVCKNVGGEIILNDEADKIEYFNINNLPKNIPPKHIERIKDALESKETVYKIQSGKSAIELLNEGKF